MLTNLSIHGPNYWGDSEEFHSESYDNHRGRETLRAAFFCAQSARTRVGQQAAERPNLSRLELRRHDRHAALLIDHFPERTAWLAELEAELFSFPGNRYDV